MLKKLLFVYSYEKSGKSFKRSYFSVNYFSTLNIHRDNTTHIFSRIKVRQTGSLFHQTNDFDLHLFTLLSKRLIVH